ncbi:hypothetical protein [Accumulibacter sp.]|uniref:hypothetical protein n=1 Tax=Accumulibacter sp. TaxID=2053492 RepID=UPI0025E7354C|nr:hypothetical protein [Accumulibacter sp.]MCM8596711.1 hypothetical protein [Accumulibacter sp.]MCM8624755.1 hypothetical protein [Accumulibacter sp.]MDS4050859.1 hypothetical protein [Accumulibacter sp.]
MTGSPDPTFRDFRARHWLIVGLRAVHLVGVVGVGSRLISSGPTETGDAFAGVLVGSGLAMIAIDLWTRPACIGEVTGLAMLAKLGLLAWMAADDTSRIALFRIILVFSALIAHVPARLRHRRVAGLGRGGAADH